MNRATLLPLLSIILLLPYPLETAAQGNARSAFDVLHYDAELQPDIVKKSVTGKVVIQLVSTVAKLEAVGLDCGDLTIDSVRENRAVQEFVRTGQRVHIMLSRPAKSKEKRQIEIKYHGSPRRGIRFFPDQQQVYTVFSTSQWLVCVDAPDDKATFRLKLIVPENLNTVGNGRLAARSGSPARSTAHEWIQEIPIPTYVFGFAVGPFRAVTEKSGRLKLQYLTKQFSDDQLRRIFRDTSDMIAFYEERSGVPYADTTYSQVLAAGQVEQEMSGFTVIRETYGNEVLANERDIVLGAHELAHQWWGNMVTCRDWNHFWLNEGIATFMAAAYKEHRFGKEDYLREIELSRSAYQKVRDAGKDRSLVFPDWNSPSAEDRTLVYDKGAYVLHLLRAELGEPSFWAGIRLYTRKYFGKSVTTPDFQKMMEQASGKDLTNFFSKWVYLNKP